MVEPQVPFPCRKQVYSCLSQFGYSHLMKLLILISLATSFLAIYQMVTSTSGDIGSTMPSLALRNLEIEFFMIIADRNELSFSYNLFSALGIDLSNNLLHGEIPSGLFGLHGLQYVNLSYNFLDGHIRSNLKMMNLRALDLSQNSLSGQIPENISRLRNLTLLDLSYNYLYGIVPNTPGYWKFPGAFAGNPELCIESSNDRCKIASLLAVPRKTFEEEMEEGPISVWLFCISALVSFYSGVVAFFFFV